MQLIKHVINPDCSLLIGIVLKMSVNFQWKHVKCVPLAKLALNININEIHFENIVHTDMIIFLTKSIVFILFLLHCEVLKFVSKLSFFLKADVNLDCKA